MQEVIFTLNTSMTRSSANHNSCISHSYRCSKLKTQTLLSPSEGQHSSHFSHWMPHRNDQRKNKRHINAKCKCASNIRPAPGGGLMTWSRRLSRFLSRRTWPITEDTAESRLCSDIITLLFSRSVHLRCRFPASTSTSIFSNTSKMCFSNLRSKAQVEAGGRVRWNPQWGSLHPWLVPDSRYGAVVSAAGSSSTLMAESPTFCRHCRGYSRQDVTKIK